MADQGRFARYRERNREACRARTREYMRRWREKNRETDRARTAAYRAANPEKAAAAIRRSVKKWREANPDLASKRCRESNAKYVANPLNKAKKAALTAAWRARNPGWQRAKNAERRDRLRHGKRLSGENREIVLLVYAEAKHRGLHVDHVIPIKGKNVCGLHVYWNMQLLTKQQNLKKSNRLLEAT